MFITPQQFAEYLKLSTLSLSEQNAILNLLPSISVEEIQEIARVLKRDVESQEKVLSNVYRKRDKLLLKFNVELERLKDEAGPR